MIENGKLNKFRNAIKIDTGKSRIDGDRRMTAEEAAKVIAEIMDSLVTDYCAAETAEEEEIIIEQYKALKMAKSRLL